MRHTPAIVVHTAPNLNMAIEDTLLILNGQHNRGQLELEGIYESFNFIAGFIAPTVMRIAPPDKVYYEGDGEVNHYGVYIRVA